ncbi:MAG: PaaI family thioesterase [Rhodomicrobiaceae bacterium]
MSDADFAAAEQAMRALVGGQGMMKHIGARIDTLEPGRAVFSLDRRDELLQHHGFFHGGAIAFLIDVTATSAAATLVNRETQSCLTAEYKLNFVSPARGDKISCEAAVVKPGRKLTVVEAKVYSHENGAAKLISVALATIAILDLIPPAS